MTCDEHILLMINHSNLNNSFKQTWYTSDRWSPLPQSADTSRGPPAGGPHLIYIYIYISLSIYIYIYLYFFISISIYLYISIFIYLYLCLSLSLYIYICIYVYAHIMYIPRAVRGVCPHPVAATVAVVRAPGHRVSCLFRVFFVFFRFLVFFLIFIYF